MILILKDETAEGGDGNKADSKARTPSTSQLFDDEGDNKANVLKKAEELRKTGCKLSFACKNLV